MVTKQRLTTFALGALLLVGCLLALLFPHPRRPFPWEQTVAPEVTASADYVNPYFTPSGRTQRNGRISGGGYRRAGGRRGHP